MRPAHTLEDGQISASNVLPAFETSLRFGASEAELEARLGWTRSQLERPDAIVSGASTYAHFELMHAKPDYPSFVLAAATAHTSASLGVVGLACKTLSNIGQALTCHSRYQRLTNRTAEYEPRVSHRRAEIRERRTGEASLGSMLVSDYTLLVAVHLLRLAANARLRALELHTRRPTLSAQEQAMIREFTGAELRFRAEHAAVVFPRSVLDVAISSADPELAAYFTGLLERALPAEPGEAPLLRAVRLQIRDQLFHGTPTLSSVAAKLGLGANSLQRRLGELGESYADLLESTRRELAAGYLRDPSLSLAEIAYLLGYAEQASFFRAFNGWYGQTPSAFRALLPPGAAPAAPLKRLTPRG